MQPMLGDDATSVACVQIREKDVDQLTGVFFSKQQLEDAQYFFKYSRSNNSSRQAW